MLKQFFFSLNIKWNGKMAILWIISFNVFVYASIGFNDT